MADLVQFIAALIIVPMDLGLWLLVIAVTLISGGFFFVVTKLGSVLMEQEKRLGGYRDLDKPEPTLEVVGDSERTFLSVEESTAADSCSLTDATKGASLSSSSSYDEYEVERERLVSPSSPLHPQHYSSVSDGGLQKAPLP